MNDKPFLGSQNIGDLAAALAAAQAEFKPASKDKVNPHFKYAYADFANVVECAKPLSKHGLSFVQTTAVRDQQTILITTLMHSSGQWIASELPLIIAKNDAQGQGSALTYAKRYSLSALLGISADEDDDGNAAVAGKQKQQQAKPQGKPEAKPGAPEIATSAPGSDADGPVTDGDVQSAIDACGQWGWTPNNMAVHVKNNLSKLSLKQLDDLVAHCKANPKQQ